MINKTNEKTNRYSVFVTSPQGGFHLNCQGVSSIKTAIQLICEFGKERGVQWGQDTELRVGCVRSYFDANHPDPEYTYAFKAYIQEHK